MEETAHINLSLDKRHMKIDGTYPVKLIVNYDGIGKRYNLRNRISRDEEDWKK